MNVNVFFVSSIFILFDCNTQTFIFHFWSSSKPKQYIQAHHSIYCLFIFLMKKPIRKQQNDIIENGCALFLMKKVIVFRRERANVKMFLVVTISIRALCIVHTTIQTNSNTKSTYIFIQLYCEIVWLCACVCRHTFNAILFIVFQLYYQRKLDSRKTLHWMMNTVCVKRNN